MLKRICMLLGLVGLLAVAIALVSGYAGEAKAPPATLKTLSKVTITDMVGRTVEVPAKVGKIVCTGPGSLRLIVYLGASDKLIGVEDAERRWGSSGRPYAMAHPELKDLPSIGPGGPGKLPNTEALIKLGPDVLFMTYVDVRTADNIQHKTNIPVVVLSYGRHGAFISEPLFRSLRLAGKILREGERAEKVIAFIKERQEDLETRAEGIPKGQKPTVYVGGIGYHGAHGIESTEANFMPFSAVHARNVVDELGGWHHFVDREKLLDWDPDIIFIDGGGFQLVKQDYQKNLGLYRSLKAFKNGKVYGILPFNFYTTNIGTALADAYYVGKVLYPDRFKDIEPEKEADKIYTFLVGRPVYSDMERDFGGFGKIDLEKGKVGKSLPISP